MKASPLFLIFVYLIGYFTTNCNLNEDKGTFIIMDLASPNNQHKITGNLSGLSGGIVLQLNNSETISLNQNGRFEFSTRILSGQSYLVSISTQPSNQLCRVSNGSGIVASNDIKEIDVTCSQNKKIFITNASYNGDLMTAGGAGSGVEGADSRCNLDANKPIDGATYKALLVDDSNRIACTSNNCETLGVAEHKDWILNPNTTYIRSADSSIIFTTNENGIFVFGNLSSSFGNAGSELTWTGLSSGIRWSTSTRHCNLWTDSTSGDEGRVGSTDQVDFRSLRFGTGEDCNTLRKLICVEQ